MGGHFNSGVHQKLTLIQGFGWKYFIVEMIQTVQLGLGKWYSVEAVLGHQSTFRTETFIPPAAAQGTYSSWTVSGSCFHPRSCSLPTNSLYSRTDWCKGVHVLFHLSAIKSEWSAQLQNFLGVTDAFAGTVSCLTCPCAHPACFSSSVNVNPDNIPK